VFVKTVLNPQIRDTDAGRLLVRPVTPDDRDLLRRGFSQLTAKSRHRRFFSPISQLSESHLQYLTEIDYRDHVAWVGILVDRPQLLLAAVGRWIRVEENPKAAEAAVVVVDRYQRRGIGGAVLEILAGSAMQLGIREFVALVQADNLPMLRILEMIGAVPAGYDAGIKRFVIPLPVAARSRSRPSSVRPRHPDERRAP
jgi:RimJ/RimL family protein N-acetyltransferase